MKLLPLVASLLTMGGLCLPPSATAQADYARPGWYAGAGLALGFEQFDGTGGADIDTAVGFDIWAGYRLIPNLAVEGQFEYVNGFDSARVETQGLTATANLKAFLMTGQVQPHVLIGVGLGWADASAAGPIATRIASDTAFILRFGGGVDFWVSENFSLGTTVTYVLGTGDLDGFDYIALGFGSQFRF